MGKPWHGIACLLLVCAATGAPRAADPPSDAEQPSSAVTVERLKSARYDNKTGMAWLEEAVIVHEGSRIAADKIELNSRKGLATASGHVRFEGERATVTSDSARADFRGRRAVFENNVRLTTSLPAADGAPGEETSMTCVSLEYFYRQRKGVAAGPVHVEQSNQSATGDAAIYDGEAETFTIMGSAKVQNDRGESFECSKAVLSLKDDTIDLEGPGKGQFMMEEQAPAE
jgi:lipopolysaccharide export system protein LptA